MEHPDDNDEGEGDDSDEEVRQYIAGLDCRVQAYKAGARQEASTGEPNQSASEVSSQQDGEEVNDDSSVVSCDSAAKQEDVCSSSQEILARHKQPSRLRRLGRQRLGDAAADTSGPAAAV